ncbi:MAG: hypothetical protein M1825_001131 [Sarcosagium campestre]|nr:MAG: hypothetical protein M1825_001131 [Sarcosagium campestre]
MASSRSPPHQMPFGYSFDNMANGFPYPSPPAPAPGPSLLDDSESNMLGDFFDRVSSATFDDPGYYYDKTIQQGGDMMFGWNDELPPTFHGTTTSLPQPATPSSHTNHSQDIRHDRRNGHMNMSPAPHPAGPTEDVLTAANTLLQNVPGQVVGGPHTGPENGSYSSRTFPRNFVQTPHGEHPLSRHPSQSYPNYRNDLQRQASGQVRQRSSPNDAVDTYFHEMMYGGPAGHPPAQHVRQAHAHKPVDVVRWGSDVSFLDNGYVAPSDQETEEDVTKHLIQKMNYMVPQPGAVMTTRTLSPRTRESQHQQRRPTVRGVSGEVYDGLELDNDRRPRKRRRSQSREQQEDEEEEDDGTDRMGRIRKKKSISTLKGKGGQVRKAPSSDASLHRRKSRSESQKPIRENLTEEQKRSNHILSEQKRRNLIKQGFDDLCELVPDLKGGGYSKSAMLVQAADWLEELLRGNDTLRTILSSLDGGSGI